MATFNDIIQKVIVRISQVPGTSVQTYAEGRIGDMVQHKFNVLFDDFWWSQFQGWTTGTLDGTTGVVTADLSNSVKRWVDIKRVFYDTDQTPLPQLPISVNPYALSAGGRPRFIDPYPADSAKVFRVWPNDATGTLRINYRTKPADFGTSDTVNMDDQVLILGAAYDYLEDDGTNPGATEKFRVMFEQRLRQLKMAESEQPIPLDGRTELIPTRWEEM